MATHINRGDYSYIDPGKYEAWTVNTQGDTSDIMIRRKT